MLLANEMRLDVLGFVDFSTLVAAKFVDARFLGVITKFAAELPCRRDFRVFFVNTYIGYIDVTLGGSPKSIRHKRGSKKSLTAACRELAAVIGQHAVAELMFSENTWNMPGVCVVFEASPLLKYAEGLELYSSQGPSVANSCEAFMHNFAALTTLRLGIGCKVFRHFSWTFLRRESARGLRLIKFTEP